MQLALVIPPKLLAKYESDTDCFFALAQYIEEPGYLDFFRKKLEEGRWVILDNGASELGRTIDIQTYFEITQMAPWSEIVLPDIQFDGIATAQTHDAFMRLFHTKRNQHQPMLMAVPQGKNEEEAAMSLGLMASRFGLFTYPHMSIGLPRLMEGYAVEVGSGPEVRVGIACDLMAERPNTPVHFLGAGPNIFESAKAALRAGVRSIDTGRMFGPDKNGEGLVYTKAVIDELRRELARAASEAAEASAGQV